MLLKDFLFSNSGSPWKSLNRSNAKYMAHQHQRPNEGVSMAVSLAFLNDRFCQKQPLIMHCTIQSKDPRKAFLPVKM